MTFGEKIQKLRKENRFSQEELSCRLNVSRQAISKWENDNGYPETEKIIRMSKIFGVTLDYLLNDENSDIERISETEQGLYVSREMANGFLLYQQLKIRNIASASSLFVASLSLTISDIAVSMLMFVTVVIISISVLVSVLFSDNPYENLWKRPLFLENDVMKELYDSYQRKKTRADILLIFGTILLAGGFMFAPLLSVYLSDSRNLLVMQLDIIFAGVGLFLCIYVSGIIRAYRILVIRNG